MPMLEHTDVVARRGYSYYEKNVVGDKQMWSIEPWETYAAGGSAPLHASACGAGTWLVATTTAPAVDFRRVPRTQWGSSHT